MRPSKGTSLTYSNTISPSTNKDNGYIRNHINYSKYYSYKQNIFSFKTRLGNILSFQNEELPVDDKFSLGGRWLRGFDVYGVGPRESTSSDYNWNCSGNKERNKVKSGVVRKFGIFGF